MSYQEVDIPPDWSLENDTFVLNRHLNVRVDLNTAHPQVVDFNIEDFRSSYERRVVSDERALAHFYNNRGIDRLQVGDPVGAFRRLRHAIEMDRGFAPAWNNLGALYSRQGYPDWAEASYLQVLKIAPREFVAMSNLARLYADENKPRAAEHYREQVRYHRLRNPYYRYQLARTAFLERDYETAIEHLKYAVRRKDREDSFYFLMGLSYLQIGQEDKARQWLTRAEEVAGSEALKRNYRSKIELLLEADGEPSA